MRFPDEQSNGRSGKTRRKGERSDACAYSHSHSHSRSCVVASDRYASEKLRETMDRTEWLAEAGGTGRWIEKEGARERDGRDGASVGCHTDEQAGGDRLASNKRALDQTRNSSRNLGSLRFTTLSMTPPPWFPMEPTAERCGFRISIEPLGIGTDGETRLSVEPDSTVDVPNVIDISRCVHAAMRWCALLCTAIQSYSRPYAGTHR